MFISGLWLNLAQFNQGYAVPPKTNITVQLELLELSTDNRVECLLVTVYVSDLLFSI